MYISLGVFAHSGAKLLVFRASNLTSLIVEGFSEVQGLVVKVKGDVRFSHSFSRFLAVGRDPLFFVSEVRFVVFVFLISYGLSIAKALFQLVGERSNLLFFF